MPPKTTLAVGSQGATVVANEIFISYRRTDEPKARLFYNLLRERGVEAWYDAKIEAGEDWRTTTANALDAAPIFVLLMSRNASESGDIAKELAAATHKRKLVVPVRLDDMQLEGMFLYELASRNWIDAYNNTEQKLAELADKLAALVKTDLSPEAAAALDMNVAQIAAAKGAEAKARRRGPMQKSGSVAMITAAAVALVGAAGGGVWFLNNTSWSKAEAASADVASGAPVASEETTRSLGLAASMTELATATKTAGRNETEVVALTAAADQLAALAGKAQAGGDAAAMSQLATEMNDIALAAARQQIAALAADPVVASVRSDFKAAESEQKSSGVKMDAAHARAIEESNTAFAALKTARETADGSDSAAAIAAVPAAQQAISTLITLRPAASEAFVKAKRQSFVSNSAAARNASGQIAQLAAIKKPGVFASSERKEAHKFLVASDAWARGRLAEIDAVAGSVATADRRAVQKYASQAATARTELEAALVTAKGEAAKLADK